MKMVCLVQGGQFQLTFLPWVLGHAGTSGQEEEEEHTPKKKQIPISEVIES